MDPSDARGLTAEPDPGRPADGGEAREGHLGFVAHEIRNPLSTALWSAELLARMGAQERGGARGEKLSAMCLRSISRVRQLLEDHLLCERLDTRGFGLRTEATAPREVLEAILVRRAAGSPAVQNDVAAELAVKADRHLLERALDALVAAAATDGAEVRVAARATEGSVALLFSGHAAEAGSLADPVKGSPSDQTGRALSLPLARRIAGALGGSLGVESGSLCLTLPRAASVPQPGAVPP